MSMCTVSSTNPHPPTTHIFLPTPLSSPPVTNLLLIFGHGLLSHLLVNKLDISLSRGSALAVQGDRNAIGDNLEPCGTPKGERGGGVTSGRGGVPMGPGPTRPSK